MENDRVYGNKWHLDRGVPIALLITVSIAGGGSILTGAWYMSSLNTDVVNLKDQIKIVSALSERMTRLEGKVDGGFAEIKALIRTPASERERRP